MFDDPYLTALHFWTVTMFSAFVFLVLFSECLASVSSTSNSSLWPWGAIQPPFPIPALYDVGLTDSMHDSVELGHGSDQVPVTVTFSFMHPTSLPCPPPEGHPVGYNYTIVLRGKESKYPRHIGPFFFDSCKGELRIPLTESLHKDSNYSAFVVAFNDDISLKSKEIYFSTGDVSFAHFYNGAQHILIVCHFTRGSRAKGCHVRLNLLNAYTSDTVKIKTLKLKANMERSTESSECIKLNRNLALGSVEVHDWKEDGHIGRLQVMTRQERSVYAPCYMISPTEWKITARLLLYAMSAAFFFGGTILILIGILCRLGRMHRHFRRDSYKVLQREK